MIVWLAFGNNGSCRWLQIWKVQATTSSNHCRLPSFTMKHHTIKQNNMNSYHHLLTAEPVGDFYIGTVGYDQWHHFWVKASDRWVEEWLITNNGCQWSVMVIVVNNAWPDSPLLLINIDHHIIILNLLTNLWNNHEPVSTYQCQATNHYLRVPQPSTNIILPTMGFSTNDFRCSNAMERSWKLLHPWCPHPTIHWVQARRGLTLKGGEWQADYRHNQGDSVLLGLLTWLGSMTKDSNNTKGIWLRAGKVNSWC